MRQADEAQAQQMAGQDVGGQLPSDPWQAGLAAKKQIEDEMGWWDKPWNWR